MDSGHSHPSDLAAAAAAAFQPSNDALPPPAASSPSRQQRLLRTRNARFSAKRISLSGISARFSDMIKTTDDKARSQPSVPRRNQENEQAASTRSNNPASLTRSNSDSLAAQLLPSSVVRGGGTLDDSFHASASMVRSLPRLASIPVFQESDEEGLHYASPTVYQAAPSPDCQRHSTSDSLYGSLTATALREISGNARKSPNRILSPAAAAAAAAAARRPASLQLSRFNPEQYIEHLEKHLELVKNDAYSPESNRPWKEKLKAAEAEKERLRSENQQMKAAFEAELQKTVEHMTATEVELRRKIRSLESDLDHKDVVIQELEMQHEERRLDQSTLDTLRSTIDKLELEKRSLEQCNESIIKRNDVLTQLLAISPSKREHPLKLSSPVRTQAKARPQSLMIPKIPSSPDAAPWSCSTATSATPSSPSLSAIAAAAAGSPSHAPRGATTPFPPLPPRTAGDSSDSDDMAPPSAARSFRSATAASLPLMSPTSCSPPPPVDDAMMSSSSSSQEQSRPYTKNRARRFLQGSTGLRPLLLPSLTSENGALASASCLDSTYRRPRNFSTGLLLHESPTPTKPRPSTSTPRGAGTIKKCQSHGFDEAEQGEAVTISDHADNAAEADDEFEYSSLRPRSSSISDQLDDMWYSLPEHSHLNCALSPDLLDSVEVPLPLFSPSVRPGTYQHRPRRRRNLGSEPGYSSSHDDEGKGGVEASSLSLSDAGGGAPRPASPSPSNAPVQAKNLVEALHQSGMAKSLTTVTLAAIWRVWSKYMTCFAVLRQSPLVLARRMMANAWRARWAMCGMMSWWVLGLFLGPFCPRQQHNSSAERMPMQHDAAAETCSDLDDDDCHSLDEAGSESTSSSSSSSSSPPGWTQRLLLWGKFSVTIMMAIGGAVVQGPAEMLKEVPTRHPRRAAYRTTNTLSPRRAETTTPRHLSHTGADESEDSEPGTPPIGLGISMTPSAKTQEQSRAHDKLRKLRPPRPRPPPTPHFSGDVVESDNTP